MSQLDENQYFPILCPKVNISMVERKENYFSPGSLIPADKAI